MLFLQPKCAKTHLQASVKSKNSPRTAVKKIGMRWEYGKGVRKVVDMDQTKFGRKLAPMVK